jgi:hypothetical protein
MTVTTLATCETGCCCQRGTCEERHRTVEVGIYDVLTSSFVRQSPPRGALMRERLATAAVSADLAVLWSSHVQALTHQSDPTTSSYMNHLSRALHFLRRPVPL